MAYSPKPFTQINRLKGAQPPLIEVGLNFATAAVVSQIRQALGIDPSVIPDGVTGTLYLLVVNNGVLGIAVAPGGAVAGVAPIYDPVTGNNYFPVVNNGILGIEQIL